MDKKRLVLYQINPRMFTPQGTLRAAKALLPHIVSTGANVAYLFAICKEDDSKDRRFWSRRQKKSKLNNPKNPYRISDYFSIDEEFGGNEQLGEFVEEAHKLGLYVMLDLVYLHCSPNAKVIADVPDGILRDGNGLPKLGTWNFPLLNFESRALRDYLIENMRYFVREYDIDGYRCDVGDGVPLDFWEEAEKEISKLKPNMIMLNEGCNPEYVKSGVFDFNYYWPPLVHAKKPFADFIKAAHDRIAQSGTGEKGIYFIENHDTVTDDGRADLLFGTKVCDCFYVYLFTVNGTPLLYCGEEIADLNEHNMFANREHNRGYGVDWSNALLPHGRRRFALIKKLADLRKEEPALAEGSFAWLDAGADVLAYERESENDKISVFINFSEKRVAIKPEGEKLFSRGYNESNFLTPNGFAVFKKTDTGK